MSRPPPFTWIRIAALLVLLTACGRPFEKLRLPTGDGSVQTPLQAATVWTVGGRDARGNYTGRVELIPDGQGYRFLRVIDYDPAVWVEDGRSLAWVWEGVGSLNTDGSLSIQVALQRADFIKRRGSLVRTGADAQPVAVQGRFVPAAGTLAGSFTGPGIAAKETWSSPNPGGPRPIFERRVTERPTHGTLSEAERAALFLGFSSYHALPEIQPYVDRPEFKNPVHRVIIDQTDFDFYQQHPNSLRVIGKVVDPISLQETLARADAYKWTLGGKAAFYDEDVARHSIDPATGMVFEALADTVGGIPSHDSALWTGAYVASQAYRARITGAPEAVNHIVRSVQGLLTLAEITGDRRTFARTLRAAKGNPMPPWHAGQGPYAALEWKEGGNNDMFKGVMYGLTTTHALLCERPTGHDALCARIRANVRQIADRLELTQDHGLNRLAALWLAAYVTRNLSYLLRATQEWNLQAPILDQGNVTMVYKNGIADWSGTHLALVEYMMFRLLADRYSLPGIDAGSTLRHGIEKIYREFSKVRMGLWSVPFAKLGTSPHPDAAETARWRLRELPAPKPQLDVDHRIRPDYVMSPFPSAPWKQDWTQNDRTQSLRSYPLFQATAYTVYDWKQSPFEYRSNNTGLAYPGVDYLIAYWLGRYVGVFSAEE